MFLTLLISPCFSPPSASSCAEHYVANLDTWYYCVGISTWLSHDQVPMCQSPVGTGQETGANREFLSVLSFLAMWCARIGEGCVLCVHQANERICTSGLITPSPCGHCLHKGSWKRWSDSDEQLGLVEASPNTWWSRQETHERFGSGEASLQAPESWRPYGQFFLVFFFVVFW